MGRVLFVTSSLPDFSTVGAKEDVFLKSFLPHRMPIATSPAFRYPAKQNNPRKNTCCQKYVGRVVWAEEARKFGAGLRDYLKILLHMPHVLCWSHP